MSRPERKLRSSNSGRRKTIMSAYGLITVGVIGVSLTWWLYAHQAGERRLSPSIKSVAVAPAPSSIKPSAAAITSYSVAASLPKYLTIPQLGITDARIIQLGLLKNGQIGTPDNIYDTGWYNASAKPGQPGAMFIYGHVSSWTANGIFYDLKKLTPGDDVIITRGDNKTYTYQVAASKIYDHNNVDMNAVLSAVDPSRPGLNLMTCTGQVIQGTSEFNKRLVVFASLINP